MSYKFSLHRTSAVPLAFLFAVSSADGVVIDSLAISSTEASPVYSAATIIPGERYLLEASGEYAWGDPGNPDSPYLGDAAYLTLDGWATLRTDVGIRASTPSVLGGISYPAVGVGSILVNFGHGPEVVDWGDYSADHVYRFEFIANADTIGFVISDWWGAWPDGNTSGFCEFQACMFDNRGALNVAVHRLESIPEPPMWVLFGVSSACFAYRKRRAQDDAKRFSLPALD